MSNAQLSTLTGSVAAPLTSQTQSRPSWPRPQHFLSYTNGKSAVRVARWPAVEPDGVHLFRARFETLKYADAFARPFTPPQPALGPHDIIVLSREEKRFALGLGFA